MKIADFGLAKLMGVPAESRKQKTESRNEEAEVTVAGSVMGTPQYMAPEQKERPAEVDHRADIYSLGVVFYQMLTGELPKGSFEPPSRKVQIDVRLDEIVLRALEREPDRRYQQASQVKTEVETLAREEPAAVAAETAHSQRGPIAALRVALIVFTATVALSVAAGGVLVLGDSPGGINGFEVMFIGSVLGVVVAVLSMLVWLLRAASVRSPGQKTSEAPPQTQTSGIPGTAIVGALGIVLFGTAACWLAAIAGQSAGDWGRMSGTERLGFVLTQALFIFGFLVAPFATTILGWTAVLQIRRSDGRLGGMPLALLDGLFFPLLALDAALMSISNAIFPYWRETIVKQGDGWGIPTLVTRMWSPIPFLITIAVVIALDVLIVRSALRAAKRPTPASSSRANNRFGTGRQLLLVLGGVLLAICAGLVIWRIAFYTPSSAMPTAEEARQMGIVQQAVPQGLETLTPERPGPTTPDGKADLVPLREAARLRLESAERILTRAQAMFESGHASYLEVVDAQRERDMAAADLKGDRAAAMQARLDAAENVLALMRSRLASSTELIKAQLERDVAAAEVQGDELAAARARMDGTEQLLRILERQLSAGRGSSVEVERARLDSELAKSAYEAVQKAAATRPIAP